MDRILEQIPRFFSATNLAFLAEAAGLTLLMTGLGCAIGFTLAFAIVFVRQTGGWWALPFRALCIVYVEVFRRIPFLVTLYLVVFFIQSIVSDVSLFAIAVTAICLYATAYISEIIRAGLESVPRQPVEAATAMNFGRLRTLFQVRLPLAMPVIIPPAIAFAVSFIKDTALVSQIGVFELTFRARELNNQGFSAILVFGTVAFVYFLMSYPLSRLGQYLETRLATPRSRRNLGPVRHP